MSMRERMRENKGGPEGSVAARVFLGPSLACVPSPRQVHTLPHILNILKLLTCHLLRREMPPKVPVRSSYATMIHSDATFDALHVA